MAIFVVSEIYQTTKSQRWLKVTGLLVFLCFMFQKFLDKSVEESGDKEKSEDYSVSLRRNKDIHLGFFIVIFC